MARLSGAPQDPAQAGPDEAAAARDKGPRRRTLVLIAVFVLFATAIAGAGRAFWQRERSQSLEHAREEINAIGALKAEQLSAWLVDLSYDIGFLQRSSVFAASAEALTAHPRDPRLRAAVAERLRARMGPTAFGSLALLGRDGRAVSTEGRPVSLNDPGFKATLAGARAAGGSHFADLHEGAGGEPHLEYIATIYEDADPKRPVVGYLVARVYADAFLYPYIQRWPVPSRTGETLLVRREGDEVVFLNDLRHRSGTALKLRFPAGESLLPAARAIAGAQGVAEGTDYRGVRVMAATRHVPNSPWYIVSKVDVDELEAPIRRQGALTGGIVAALILALAASVGVVWRTETAHSQAELLAKERQRVELAERLAYMGTYSNDIIYLADEDLRLIDVNPRAEETYGYSREELLGMTITDLRAPEEAATVDIDRALVHQLGGALYETVHRRSDGTTFPVELSARELTQDGRTLYLGVVRDITRRKQAEQALKDSESRYHMLFDTMLSCFVLIEIVCDETGTPVDYLHLEVNPAYEAATGLRADDITGKPVSEVIPDQQETRRWVELFGRVALSGEPIHYEDYSPGLDRWYEGTAFSAGANRVAVMLNDVTERRKAQEQLRESEEMYRSLFENMLNGFAYCRMLFDDGVPQDFIYLAVNAAFETQTGLKDVIGKRVSEVIPGIREADPELFERYGRVALTGKPEAFEIHVDAMDMWFSISVYSPEREHFVAVFDVITERKKAEEEIGRLNRDLERRVEERTQELAAANRELEAFAYSVSHDLKAPLRGMDGFAKLLLDEYSGSLDEQGARYLRFIRDNSAQMARLIEDLLSFSRLGRAAVRRTDVDTKALVEQVTAELEAQNEGRRIRCELGDLPVVSADPTLLRQVFVNLLSNAVKFTRDRDEALIEVGTYGEHDDQRVFFVRDNGVGFDMAYEQKLFGVFQRLHPSDDYEGTGVGLANVARIVKRHGGKVWAESAVGKGARFYFTIGKGDYVDG